ncbi:hypothetical protein B0H19DRAFT_1267558 [Mycena capillaripes]|nr:hypothetical protein B0H19DRAFT_1267558 [Mycena capillaripes]
MPPPSQPPLLVSTHNFKQGHTTYIDTQSDATATIVAGSDYFSAIEFVGGQAVDDECVLHGRNADCTVRIGGSTTVVTVPTLQTQVLDVVNQPNSSQEKSYSVWVASLVVGLSLACQFI